MSKWGPTQEEISKKNSEKQIDFSNQQTLSILHMLKLLGDAVMENKNVSVINTHRTVDMKRPDWLMELKKDDSALIKTLNDIDKDKKTRSKDLNQEVIKAIREIKFPEQKEGEKISLLLEKLHKTIQKKEITEQVEITNPIEIKEPKWWQPIDLEKPVLSFARFLKELLGKTVFNVTGSVRLENPTVKVENPVNEVSVKNFEGIIKELQRVSAEVRAMAQTTRGGMAGGGSVGITPYDPLIKYQISDQDNTGNPSYFGFASPTGSWYIMKQDTAANTYRYASGSTGYATNWTNRASLTYDYIFNIILS